MHKYGACKSKEWQTERQTDGRQTDDRRRNLCVVLCFAGATKIMCKQNSYTQFLTIFLLSLRPDEFQQNWVLLIKLDKISRTLD